MRPSKQDRRQKQRRAGNGCDLQLFNLVNRYLTKKHGERLCSDYINRMIEALGEVEEIFLALEKAPCL